MSETTVHAEGVGDARRGIERIRFDARRELENILRGTAAYSEVMMKQYAPGSIKALTGMSGPHWTGANTLEAEAGVRPGSGMGGRDPRYPLYVHGGTGIYNLHEPKFITPNRPRGVLRFEKRGEGPKYRKWVRGQRPQPFVYYAYQLARVYVEARIRTFHLPGRR